MNIDVPPPSNGVYSNAGSSRRLAGYLEHEDMGRMERGFHTEGFFDLTDDNIYKSQVIRDIDGNTGQLLKTDAKFYAIHVSPSENELRAMGATEREQAEAVKRYIREVFIPEYARNFNKGLSAEDIRFYGKVHFSRERSDNELNVHCHLIVSRKDQAGKKKLSPLTNHRNTGKGVIEGGFDRKTLFGSVEKGFDRLFGYNRWLSETFEYCNTMKNGTISEQLKMQERAIDRGQGHSPGSDWGLSRGHDPLQNTLIGEKEKQQTVGLPDMGLGAGLSSALGILTPDPGGGGARQSPKPGKKKKRGQGQSSGG